MDIKSNIKTRILMLRDDQIAALFPAVGITFSHKDIPKVIAEIRERGEVATHLSTLIDEADSKESLEWWVSFFEKANNTSHL